MNKSMIRFLWIVSGIVLIFAGIVVISSPMASLLSMALVIGIAALISGISSMIIYFTGRKELPGSGWILADGIITVLVGVFLVTNQLAAASVIPYVFGMWVIFTGIGKLVSSFELKDFGLPKWFLLTILGVLQIVVGFLAMMNPVITALIMTVLLGILLLLQGISSVVQWLCTLKK